MENTTGAISYLSLLYVKEGEYIFCLTSDFTTYVLGKLAFDQSNIWTPLKALEEWEFREPKPQKLCAQAGEGFF